MNLSTTKQQLIILTDDEDDIEIIESLSCIPEYFKIIGVARSSNELALLCEGHVSAIILADRYCLRELSTRILKNCFSKYNFKLPIVLMANSRDLSREEKTEVDKMEMLHLCPKPILIADYYIVAETLQHSFNDFNAHYSIT